MMFYGQWSPSIAYSTAIYIPLTSPTIFSMALFTFCQMSNVCQAVHAAARTQDEDSLHHCLFPFRLLLWRHEDVNIVHVHSLLLGGVGAIFPFCRRVVEPSLHPNTIRANDLLTDNSQLMNLRVIENRTMKMRKNRQESFHVSTKNKLFKKIYTYIFYIQYVLTNGSCFGGQQKVFPITSSAFEKRNGDQIRRNIESLETFERRVSHKTAAFSRTFIYLCILYASMFMTVAIRS